MLLLLNVVLLWPIIAITFFDKHLRHWIWLRRFVFGYLTVEVIAIEFIAIYKIFTW